MGKIHANAIRMAWMKKAEPQCHDNKKVIQSIKRKKDLFKNIIDYLNNLNFAQ